MEVAMETVVAIYEQGVLRPLRQLFLAEHARVRVQIVEDAPHVPPDYPLLAFADLGRTEEADVSDRVEEILANEISAQSGWSVTHANAG
jgi:hypothetical protein